jgi:hypothetical protein
MPGQLVRSRTASAHRPISVHRADVRSSMFGYNGGKFCIVGLILAPWTMQFQGKPGGGVTMQTRNVRRHPLRTAILITAGLFACFGFGFALVASIGALTGVGDAYSQFGVGRITGTAAAVLGLPVMTLVCALGGAAVGAVFYGPIKVVQGIFGSSSVAQGS